MYIKIKELRRGQLRVEHTFTSTIRAGRTGGKAFIGRRLLLLLLIGYDERSWHRVLGETDRGCYEITDIQKLCQAVKMDKFLV